MSMIDLGPDFAAQVPSEALKTTAWVRIDPVPPQPPNPVPPGSMFRVVVQLRDLEAQLRSRDFADLAKCRVLYDKVVALGAG